MGTLLAISVKEESRHREGGPTQDDNAVLTMAVVVEPLTGKAHLLHCAGLPVIC